MIPQRSDDDPRSGAREDATRSWTSPSNLKSAIEFTALAITALYALGYLSWTLYAESRGLGTPPVFRAQYIGGGIAPAILCLTLYVGLRLLSRLWARLGQVDAKYLRWGRRLMGLAALIAAAAFFIEPYRMPLVYAASLAALASSFLSRDALDRVLVKSTYWYIVFTLVGIGFIGLTSYAVHIFPVIPVELGGARPQCVSLDLDQRKVSIQTAMALAADGVGFRDVPVRTKPLWLLFDDASHLILGDGTTRQSNIRIRTDAIGAILKETSCQAEPAPPR